MAYNDVAKICKELPKISHFCNIEHTLNGYNSVTVGRWPLAYDKLVVHYIMLHFSYIKNYNALAP